MLGSAPLGGVPLGAPIGESDTGPLDIVMSEGVGLGQVFVASVPRSATLLDGVRFEVIPARFRATPVTAADGLGVSASVLAYYGQVLVERLRLVEALIPNAFMHVRIDDLVQLITTLRQALPVALVDGVGMASATQAQRSIRVLEAIQLHETVLGAAHYHVSIAQVLRLHDSLANFFGASIADGIGIGSTLTARALAMAGLSETMQVSATLVPKLLLSVTVPEGVRLSAVQAVKMLFRPTLREGVVFEAGYVAPDGGFTTWVMNTRTGGVTEYDNYAFNSFAQMGAKYLGASDSGLYELLGDDDDGTDIIARIKGGFLQFGGTQLSRLKEAYIAARGGGQFVLKIRTADGLTYNYLADTRNMRSSKVHMGKGQKSRYFAFELISTGQDFDLDTLEFVPIVVQRRV